MPAIRDIYDPNDGQRDNVWQRTVYTTLRARLELEDDIPAEPKEFASRLQDRNEKRASALAFLATYGWVIGELRAEATDEELNAQLGRASKSKHAELYEKVLDWAEREHKEISAWRVYRTVKGLSASALTTCDDPAIERYWPGEREQETGDLPNGFPTDRLSWTGGAVELTRPSVLPVPPKPGGLTEPPYSEAAARFPEFFVHSHEGTTTEEKAQIRRDNEHRLRFYQAVRYLLKRDFGFADLPATTIEFVQWARVDDRTGAITPLNAARCIGIVGSLLARNLTDPLLGRPVNTRWADDLLTKDERHLPIRIAKRFADGVVAAVQEYTSRAGLYTEAQKLLVREGFRLNGHQPQSPLQQRAI